VKYKSRNNINPYAIFNVSTTEEKEEIINQIKSFYFKMYSMSVQLKIILYFIGLNYLDLS